MKAIEDVLIEANAMHSQAHLPGTDPVSDSGFDHPCSSRTADVTETMRKRGWVFLKVSGKSMFPWIRESDIVFLRHMGICEVGRGDVIVFEKNGMLCVHRVLAIRGDVRQGANDISLITKGDATADADSLVSSDEVLGKVEFVYRRNREIRIASGWRKAFGRFLAFLSPTVAWYRPFLSHPSSALLRRESHPLSRIDVRRSSENSVD